MILEKVKIYQFRNIQEETVRFSEGTNILFGNNAQGKTNLLESVFLLSTTKSHRGQADKEMIRFGKEEAHIRASLKKMDIDYTIDIHLQKNKAKVIKINDKKIRRAADLMGLLHIVIFSPEDLSIVKEGPAERRRFLDICLCQLEENYLHDLTQYNKIVEARNRILKQIGEHDNLKVTLDIWDDQLTEYGKKVIERRKKLIEDLNDIIGDIHSRLSGGGEKLRIEYLPNTEAESFEKRVKQNREKDIFQHMTTVGPHRDDFCFKGGSIGSEDEEIDFRRFGSQGQQRTCALSLKLAEIEIVKKRTGDNPIFLLDDVLSELDRKRQEHLLESIGGIQTFITCTGMDEMIQQRLKIDKVFRVENGSFREA